MTAPGFSVKKKDLLTQIEKTPEPPPPSWRRRCRHPVRTGPGPSTALWHMGTGEGIFLTSAWNPLPRGVEPRTWGVPLGHLTVWARRPLANFRNFWLHGFLCYTFNLTSHFCFMAMEQRVVNTLVFGNICYMPISIAQILWQNQKWDQLVL